MSRLFTLEKKEKGLLLSAADKGKSFAVYTSDSPDDFDENSSPVRFEDEVMLEWDSEKRPFCHIFWNDCHTVVSFQELRAGDSYNLRDLGGYLTASGDAAVRFGLIYRSDQPFSMGDDVARIYKKLGLRTVFDLRGSYEHNLWPDPEVEGVNTFWTPAQDENPVSPPDHTVVASLSDIFRRDDAWKHESTLSFTESYLVMPFGNPAYRKMFSCLLNSEVPVLIHCLAGKDRTGIGAMLILLALGVPESTILEDYTHRSAAYQAYIDFREDEMREFLKTDVSKKHFGYFFGVLRENLEGSLRKIHEEYESTEDFFLRSYGLTEEDLGRLRELYLLPIRQ